MANGEMRYVGTGFFIGRSPPGYVQGLAVSSGVRLVTARHLLDRISKKLGLTRVFVRINTTSGNAIWVMTDIAEWKYHPTDETVDIAMLPFGFLADFDHLAIPELSFFTPAITSEHEITLGEEVFITGLFRHHHGKMRNIPIIRVGNLAALDEEKVQTSVGLCDAYLIEVPSLGGLSGSPVFLNLGVARRIKGRHVVAAGGGPIIFLLGLIHGHFEIPAARIDADEDDPELTPEKINTGIAIVVPASKIMEAFNVYSPVGVPPIQIRLRILTDEQLADSDFNAG
jgi:hypothetical protein